jgi:catechol 2,3-dioxygenase-like lactoylglutathione lyase family enzyme
MFTIETLHHVSIPVIDIEISKKFYREILNLQEIERPPLGFPGAWFKIGDREIHLIQNTNEKSNPTFRTGKNIDSRDTHFAIRVKSYQEVLDHLYSKGFHPDAQDEFKRIKVNPKANVGFPQIYIMDPDRNMIEFNAAELD